MHNLQITGHTPIAAVPRKEDSMLTQASQPSRLKKSNQVFTQLSSNKTGIS